MLTAASRVPDHGKLAPWRFVLIRGEARERLGEKLVEILERRDGPLSALYPQSGLRTKTSSTLTAAHTRSDFYQPLPQPPRWRLGSQEL